MAASLPIHDFVHHSRSTKSWRMCPPGRPFVDGVHVARAAASEADRTRRDCRRLAWSALRCRRTGCHSRLGRPRRVGGGRGSHDADGAARDKARLQGRTHGRAVKTRRHDFRDDDGRGGRSGRASLLAAEIVSRRLQRERGHCPAGRADRRACDIDMVTGRTVRQLPGGDAAMAVPGAPLVVVADKGASWVISAASGDTVARFPVAAGDGDAPLLVSVSADQRYVMIGRGSAVRLLDSTGKVLSEWTVWSSFFRPSSSPASDFGRRGILNASQVSWSPESWRSAHSQRSASV